jgi:hypothetical protein
MNQTPDEINAKVATLTEEQHAAVTRLIEFFDHGNRDILDCGCPVHDAFGLSYASYHVLPRALLEAMPLAWKLRFCHLMDQFSEEFPGYGNVSYEIERTHPEFVGWSPAAIQDELDRTGEDKVPTVPDPLANYRHPDRDEIDRMRRKTP